jgi:hypothetical protein
MPAAELRYKLRDAIGNRSINSVAVQTESVKMFQIKNILDGRTEPWNVRVRTAQQLCDLFPFHLRITDFFKGRPKVTL